MDVERYHQAKTAALFELADQVLLGDYVAAVIVDDSTHQRSFRVERYTLPTFRVELTTDKPSYRPQETLRGTLRAAYTSPALSTRQQSAIRMTDSAAAAGKSVPVPDILL